MLMARNLMNIADKCGSRMPLCPWPGNMTASFLQLKADTDHQPYVIGFGENTLCINRGM